ncbi:hypothetical protein EsH8_VI_000881 [Colletotrichum jinshuiense]
MSSIYPNRLANRCIRLLVLHPGSASCPIRLDLQDASIDDPPPFEALSYVWGDPSQRKNVKCSCHTVSVTKNLYDALQHFRLPDRELLIWVDALCINQEDMEERAHQVQLMRGIYTRATRVVVWLGLDDEGKASLAIPLIQAIHQACEDQALAKGVELLSMAHFTPAPQRLEGLAGVSMADIAAAAERMGRLKPDEAAWAALAWLLSRPWFTRVWCVQEIVLARSSVVYVGSCSLDWVKLGVTAAWLSEQSLTSGYDVPSELEGLRWDNAYAMFDTSELSESSFLDVLVYFRDHNATDPRDKVYGLLGLISCDALELFPGVDYMKSTAEVYTDVVRTSVSSSGTLVSLCYVQHGLQYVQTEFPSWVPRWDISGDVANMMHALSLNAWEDGDKHGLPTLGNFDPSSDGRVTLPGVRFDAIAWVTDVFDVEHFKEDISPSVASRHPFLDLWNRAASNTSYPLYPSAEDSLTAILEMAVTLTAGFNDVYDLIVELESSDEREQFYADYLTYVHKLFDTAGLKSQTFDPLDIALSDGTASRFRVAASRSCDQRRVFETAGGFYGLAPACAREGDMIVLLYGGPIPFVLRKAEDGWLLLGDSFVGPLMPESADEDIRKKFGDEEAFMLV